MDQIFEENKYRHIYERIILHAQHRNLTSYTEKHHIIPKSLGGRHTSNNIVHLTAKEHYIAHACLTRCTKGQYLRSMVYAFHMMGYARGSGQQQTYRKRATSSVYQKNKIIYAKFVSERSKGHVASIKTRQKMSAASLGRPKTSEHALNISRGLSGKPKTPEHMNKINHNPEKIAKTAEKHRGMKRTMEARAKMSAAAKERIQRDGGPYNKGIRGISEETREKMRAAKAKYFANGGAVWNKAKTHE